MVVSELGQGTTFSFTLLLDTVADAPKTSMNDVALDVKEESRALLTTVPFSLSSEESAVSLEPPRGHRVVHLLVAEDMEINRKLIKRMAERSLRTLGMRVELDMAEDGAMALALWRKKGDGAWDMAFLDNEMPTMTGQRCTELMRAEGCLLPIVGITASINRDREWFAAGLTDMLRKPFKEAELRAVFRQHLVGTTETPATGVGGENGVEG